MELHIGFLFIKIRTTSPVKPSEAQDVLDPPATGRGVIGGQRLSGLNKALFY
ncbi:hypothetical protein J2S25_002287 [Mesobacillus stamsii]|uniref:Uncharacterized protein n=1 Tax=Mesobacillus stamsii TaxID=225347 RepID=A0ABU0FVY3_9BACI|nr:hypothetical protein [Mesobacillus stamsii]